MPAVYFRIEGTGIWMSFSTFPYTGIPAYRYRNTIYRRYIGVYRWYSRVFRRVNKFTSRLRHLSSLYGYENGPASAIVNTAVVKGHVQEAAVNLVDEDEDGSDDEEAW